MLNIATILEDSARNFPNKDAFRLNDAAFTFAEINAMANKLANALQKKGIQKNDKVAISCFNLPYFPIVYFAILKTGAVAVPLSVLLKAEEIAYHLKNSDAKAFFCFTGTKELPMVQMGMNGFNKVEKCTLFVEITPQLSDSASHESSLTLASLVGNESPTFNTVSTSPDDTAVIIHTSGTTGKPKGAELTHANLMINAMISSQIGRTSSEDVQIVVLPLFHIFALTFLMNAGVYKGVTSILLPRFSPKSIFELIQKNNATIFAGVPTMYWSLIEQSSNISDPEKMLQSLRICVSGGASLPLKLLTGFQNKFNVPIIEGYGMSEGSPVVTFNHLHKERKPGSIGTPIWGVEVKIVDDKGNEVGLREKGELIYKGHNVMKGYYNDETSTEKTIKDGWLYSGDVAIKDEDGYFYIVDRTKDMIIRGGLNVYPREIEEVILQNDKVSLAAVIGIPDEKFGEEIKAFVVLKDKEALSERELITFTKSKLASYKYPRKVSFVEGLPMSATGKILKKELKELV